jgi:PilZ domain
LNEQLVETTLYSLSANPPRRPERRSQERFLSLLRVGALRIGRRRELCLIRNISEGGMMIRPYSDIEAGTRLSVELKHGDSVSGTAQWSERGFVGVTFDAPIDVLALLSASGMETQPRMPRIEVDCLATVRDGAAVHRSRTCNISQGGICLRMTADLRIGAHVVVSIAGLAPAGGVVKWRDEDNYGIGFNRVFPVGELMAFLQEKKNDERRHAAG